MFTKIAIVCGPQQFTNELPMTSSHFLITAGSVRLPPNKNLPFIYLIGGLEHFFIFHNIWDVILPIDELIFFKMVKTTNRIH